MTDDRIIVRYDHRQDDTDTIWIGIAERRNQPRQWKPALRDIIDGRRVVWARFPDATPGDSVWIRDNDGDKRKTTIT